ncbi:hypothetical protein BXP70_18045 [Hymenobacter crusticola]|uniref:Uncharacterized protein n=1 Tax=Hymenobacter crusticola TaxID=1770526 RepID=A0A243WA71_9BACT|nr:hypothetical protein BXP70_18045 [Hymenobacter crusticola]
MKRVKQLIKSFGILAERPFAALPTKISNVQVARVTHCKNECPFCFPHGVETSNATILNRQRSWKRFRKTQWKR